MHIRSDMAPKCSSIVAVFLILCVQNNEISADFGLPLTVDGGYRITSSVNGINSILNTVNINLRRFDPSAQYGPLRSSSEKIAQMLQKITNLEKLITSNVTKVATDKVTPVKELFNALQKSYEQMSQYLKSDAQESMNSLNDSLGTTELEKALDGVSEAIANVTAITVTFEQAIVDTLKSTKGKPVTRSNLNEYISPSLTTSMSQALEKVKDQTTFLSRAVEYVLKNIALVDSYIARVNATALSLEQKVNATLLGMEQAYLAEVDSIVKRLYASHNTIRNELSGSVSKLSLFRTNQTLSKLVDGFSEAYTKMYYYLYNRNQTDGDSIQEAYQDIIAYMNQQTQYINSNFTAEMLQSAIRVGYQFLNQNANYDNCFNNYQNQLFATLSVINGVLINCLGREKNRMGRLPDVIDRFLRQTDVTAEDFGLNIASCTVQSRFANSPTTYVQALTCLNTTLNHTESFQQVITQVYDNMLQITRTEVNGIQFRLGDCLVARGNEGIALIGALDQDIEECLYGKSGMLRIFVHPVDKADMLEQESAAVTETREEDNLYGEVTDDMLGNY